MSICVYRYTPTMTAIDIFRVLSNEEDGWIMPKDKAVDEYNSFIDEVWALFDEIGGADFEDAIGQLADGLYAGWVAPLLSGMIPPDYIHYNGYRKPRVIGYGIIIFY